MYILQILTASKFEIFHFLIYFSLYSFVGWLIEVLYRSFKQKHFVNAGFLFGTFVPIYGMGAVSIILLEPFIRDYNIILQIVLYGVLVTVIEYIVGMVSEKIFGLALWDYSENKFNLNGKICLSFSIIWAFLVFIFIMFIHPLVNTVVVNLGDSSLTILSAIVVIYFTFDFAISSIALTKFTKILAQLYANNFKQNNIEMERFFSIYKRLLSAFPNLIKYLDENISSGIKMQIKNLLLTTKDKLTDLTKNIEANEEEYNSIVQDILNNKEFLKTKNFYHHNSSIYEHVLRVSYLSYKICKYLKFDFKSAARGGLLHDFFLYDWRNHSEPELAKEKFHGIEHPRIALKNSENNSGTQSN